MKTEKLIKMANNIGNFFASETDKDIAINGIKNHLLKTWEPRMRKELIEYAKTDGAELSALVRNAVHGLQAEAK